MAGRAAFPLGLALGFALGFVFGTDPVFPDVQEHDGISYDPSIDPDNGGHVVVRVPGQAAQHGRLQDMYTFTRNSVATYRGRDGLLKFANENVWPRSQEFDNGVWTKHGVTVTADGAVAPDLTTTADTIVEDGTTAPHDVQQNVVVAGLPYTLSVYAKPINRTWIYLQLGNEDVYFNLVGAGTVGAVSAGFRATITALDNGWYRVTLTGVPASAGTFIGLATGDGVFSYTGLSQNAVYLWGAQAQRGYDVGKYVSTAGAAKYDQPRIEYVNGTYSYAPHNHLIGSERYGQAGFWGDNGGTVILNAAPAPDGRMIASVFRTTSASEQGRYQVVAGVTSGRTYTLSAVFKVVSGTGKIRIGCDTNPANGTATFNMFTNEITSIGANALSPTIVDLGGGYKVLAISFVATSTSCTVTIYNDGGGQPTPDANSFSVNSALLQEFATVNREKYIETQGTAIAPVQTYENARPGLLHEGGRTNTGLQSEDQTSATWTKAGMLAFGAGSVSNSTATLDPMGGNTADLLTPDTGLTVHTTTQSFTATAASWTLSFFYKANGYTRVAIREVFATAAQAVWTCSGVGSVSDLNAATARIEAWGNGWYRCIMTYTGTAAAHAFRIHILDPSYPGGSVAAHSYSGDGVSGGYVWGIQAEAGGSASSYIQTTTATVSRAGELITRPNGGEVLATAGTVVVDCDFIGISPIGGAPMSADDGSTNNFWRITDNTAGNLDWSVRNGGALQAAIPFPITPLFTRARYAGAYASNDFAYYKNGVAGTPDSSGLTPASITRSLIGGDPFGGGMLGHIFRADYWPERLPNAAIVALTST